MLRRAVEGTQTDHPLGQGGEEGRIVATEQLQGVSNRLRGLFSDPPSVRPSVDSLTFSPKWRRHILVK